MSLKTTLINKIKEDGAISLENYMGLCNHHYYNTRDPFGAQGDFTTAPEMSQMFGELLAAWFVDVLGQFGSVTQVTLLECGPGRGTLMRDMLRIISNRNILKCDIKAVLMEQSACLKKVQEGSLKEYDIVWIEGIQQLQTELSTGPLFVIGNEFFDALPIRQYVYRRSQWFERYVNYTEVDDAFISTLLPTTFLPPLQNPREGDIYEISPAVAECASSLSQIMAAQGGGALFIDYGYHQAETRGGTFQAVKDHTFANPYEDPGNADLTAHVNFAELARVFKNHGLAVHGPARQGDFLLQLGLQERANALKLRAGMEQKKDIDAAVRRLSGPDQMGALFKVIAATSQPINAAGFL